MQTIVELTTIIPLHNITKPWSLIAQPSANIQTWNFMYFSQLAACNINSVVDQASDTTILWV